MKRAVFGISIAVFAVVAFYGSSTNAVNRTFEERFLVNGRSIQTGESGTYNFDKAHSFIAFKVKHNGLIEVPGFFRDFTGTVTYDAADPSKSSVAFTAKAASIDTGVQGRDTHLRTADFFRGGEISRGYVQEHEGREKRKWLGGDRRSHDERSYEIRYDPVQPHRILAGRPTQRPADGNYRQYDGEPTRFWCELGRQYRRHECSGRGR
jgi:hypothetical protein